VASPHADLGPPHHADRCSERLLGEGNVHPGRTTRGSLRMGTIIRATEPDSDKHMTVLHDTESGSISIGLDA
jgi:hypothetical protein